MRILQISSARAFGGGERHFADLTRALHARGHQVYVALSPNSPLGAALDALPAENIFTLNLRNSLDLGSAVKLSRTLRERRIEIVHAHIGRDYPVAAIAAWKTPAARLVLTRHVLFPLSRLHRLTFSRASRVIAVSEAVARAMRSQKLFPADRLRVIPNGIEIERFDVRAGETRNSSWHFQSGPGFIGTIGELSRVKGQEDFLRAAAIVARECEAVVHFLVVGEDKSRGGAERVRLLRLVADLGIADRVYFLGQRDADLPFILSSLDVFVSASHSEAFGLSIIEAMAAGKPVVATATAGAREIITDAVTGRLVPVGAPAKMAAAILGLLRDERARHRLGDEGRRMVRDRYTVERMVGETEEVYREAVGESISV